MPTQDQIETIKGYLVESLLRHRDSDELSENEEDWLDYISNNLSMFCHLQAYYWGREKLYDCMIEYWDQDDSEEESDSSEHSSIDEVRDEIRGSSFNWEKSRSSSGSLERMGVDMAKNKLLSNLSHWATSDLSPEEATPYMEKGVYLRKAVHRFIDEDVSPEEAGIRCDKEDLIELGLEPDKAQEVIEEYRELAPPEYSDEECQPTIGNLVCKSIVKIDFQNIKKFLNSR